MSGDHNPIHLYPLTAKALGFKRQIAHGMWTKARCVAALENRLPDAVRVDVAFKKPVFLPGTVAFGSTPVDDGYAFSLSNPRTRRPAPGGPHDDVDRASPERQPSRPARADQALLGDGRDQGAVRLEDPAEGEPARAAGRGRPLVVEPPLVDPERPVEPDGVVERGHLRLASG